MLRFSGSVVHGLRFHSHPRTASGMRIYEKSVSFIRPNPRFGAKLAIILEDEHFYLELWGFNAVFVLNPERCTLNL
jgi:hypothetical protein